MSPASEQLRLPHPRLPQAPLQLAPEHDQRNGLEPIAVEEVALDSVGGKVGRREDREDDDQREERPLPARRSREGGEPDGDAGERDDEGRALGEVVEDDAEDQDGAEIQSSALPLVPALALEENGRQ